MLEKQKQHLRNYFDNYFLQYLAFFEMPLSCLDLFLFCLSVMFCAPQRPEKVIRCPETRAIDGCEPGYGS